MTEINIDGKEFNTEDLSENARSQIGSMQACDQKISQLQVDLAIAQTARSAYASVLRDELPEDEGNSASLPATNKEKQKKKK